MVALKDIEIGEELVHTYIDNEEPYDIRKEDLKEYGFECDCPKCKEESAFE